MKRKFVFVLATGAWVVGSATPSFAATDTFQGGSATTPTWDQPTNWSLGAKPTAADDAVFPTPIPTTPGATIGLGAGETASTLTFNNAYTLGTAAGTGDLTLTAGTVTVANGFTANIAAQLKGTAGLTLAGPGTLALTNTTTATTNNTFSGGINLNNGTLAFTIDAELGSATGNNITFNGGTLSSTATTGTATLTGTRILNITGGGTISTAGSTTNGKILLGTAGQLTGSGPLTKVGGGDLQFGAANTTYTGAFTVSGLVEASVTGALGSGGAGNTITITKAGELAIGNAANLANAITINATGTGANPIVSPIGGSGGTLSGAITMGANPFTVALRDFNNFANGRNLTLAGSITGTGTISTTAPTAGNSTLLVNGSNAGFFTGTYNVAAGTGISFGTFNSRGAGSTLMVTSSATALGGVGVGYDPNSQLNFPTITTNGTSTFGGVFEVNTTLAAATAIDLNTLYGTTSGPIGGTAGKWFLGSATAGTYAAATLGVSSDGNYRLGGGGGTLTISAAALADAAGGATNLIVGSTLVNGGGVVVLSGNNTFTGTVTVAAGTLRVGTVANGGTASPLGAGTSAITVGTTASTSSPAILSYTGATASTDRGIVIGTGGGTVDVTTAAATLTIPSLTGGAFTKTSSGTLTVASTTPATLAALTNTAGTLNLGSGNNTVTGLTTLTAGTLTLGSTSNTLTGGTAVNGGTLNTGPGTNTLAGATNVNVGTLNANGTTQFTGATAVGVNGVASVVAGSGAAVSFTGGNALTVGTATGTSTTTTTGTLNLASAASFTATVGAFNVGNVTSSAGTGDTIGVVTLPANSTITATSVLIADSPSPGNTTRTSTLTFGAGNSTLQTPTLTVGARKAKGALTVAAGGTVTINNGVTGGVTNPTALVISSQDPGSGTFATGDFNFTNGTLIGTFGTVVVGDKTTTAGTGAGGATGTFTLGPSSSNAVSAAGIILGRRAATGSGGSAVGTFTTGGGTVTIGSGGITDGLGGTGSSSLLLTGAGVLNMQGNNIGTAANPIKTLTYTNGTLRNLGTLSQALTQNGAASVLDVLANNTTLTSTYALTSGTAQVAVGRTLNVGTTATVGSTGTYADALGGNSTAGLLAVGGALDLTATGDTLRVTAPAGSLDGSTYTLATFTSLAGGAHFDNVVYNDGTNNFAGTDAQAMTAGALFPNGYALQYNASSLQLVSTPEPAGLALLGLLGAVVLPRRRRRAGVATERASVPAR